MKKYCTRCGKPFDAVGREVICPACKAAAAEETKRAAVERAKRASWTGESVPVRISGRASTIIREYGTAHNLPFAAALDALLKATSYFVQLGVDWEAITPYKSHRRDRHATADNEQDAPQASKPQDKPQDVKQAAKQASKATASKASASKASASKTASKAASKASK